MDAKAASFWWSGFGGVVAFFGESDVSFICCSGAFGGVQSSSVCLRMIPQIQPQRMLVWQDGWSQQPRRLSPSWNCLGDKTVGLGFVVDGEDISFRSSFGRA